jgi:DNA-binding NtrC family response regulator
MSASWPAYYAALPHPSHVLAEALCAAHTPDSLEHQVAVAHLALERDPTSVAATAALDRALLHPRLDTRLRLFLLRLASGVEILPSSLRGPLSLSALIRELATPDLPPPFRVIAPRLELSAALWRRDRAAISALLGEGETVVRSVPDSDLAREWQVQHLLCDLARHHCVEAADRLSTLEAHAALIRRQVGYDLDDARWILAMLRGDAAACARLASAADDGPRRARCQITAAALNRDGARARTLLPHAGLDEYGTLLTLGQLWMLGADAEAKPGELVRRLRSAARSEPQRQDADRLAIELALRERRAEEARFLLRSLDPNEDFGDCHAHWLRCYRLLGDVASAARHWLQVAQRGEAYARHALALAQEMGTGDLASILLALPTAGGAFIGASAAMDLVRRHIALIGPRSEPVLVIGETGCGKEIAARLLHDGGPGTDAPFVAINCGALAESLAEAELFGYVRGAFTGAERGREGAFAQAAGGTLLLDEIGAMPLRLQSLLLRVLETGDYRPIGSAQPRQVAARIISAANENLAQLAAEGRFRADLLFRLQRLTVELPPLRSHPEDIPLLATHFQREMGIRRPPPLASDLLEAWLSYSWPGNVRELRNEIETMMVLHGHEPVLLPKHTTVGRRSGITARFALAQQARLDDARTHADAQTPLEIALETPDEDESDAPHPPGGRKVTDRRNAILALAAKHGKVTRSQVVAVLGCAPNTATADLQALVDGGALRRIVMGNSLRLSYFVPVAGTASA